MSIILPRQSNIRGSTNQLRENIADYLVEGKWWSETNNGVVFFDLENNDTLKKLSHFRSTSITKNNQHIASCWIKCLRKSS